MGFAGQGADSPIMSDAFMAFRLLMSYLDDLSTAVDSVTGRLRTTDIIESGTLTSVTTVTTVTSVTSVANIAGIGSVSATGFIFDEMDVVWNTGIRPQIV